MRLPRTILPRFLQAAAVALALGASVPGLAQTAPWPSRPIRIVLPVAPGGTADATARLMQDPLQKLLGQPIVLDHRPGGAATIATLDVVRAQPDGHTFGLVSTPFASNPALLPSVPYDSAKDVTPVAFFWRSRTAWTVHKSVPINTLADLIAKSKADPGSISYGTGGVGQASHFSVVLLEQAAGIRLTHVPYRGAGPATNDAVAGHIPMLVSTSAIAAPHVESGTLRAIAVASPDRSTLLPNVPTVAELGFPGFESGEWFGVVGPAGLPDEITRRMNEAIGQALKQPEVAAQFAKLDLATPAMSPAEFRAYLVAETARMREIVRVGNIKAQ